MFLPKKRVNRDPLFNIIKQLKKSKIYDNMMEIEMKDFTLSYDVPKKYLDNQELAYEKVQSLDEVKHYMDRGLFTKFRYAV
jgi:uncharacterized protein YpbB